MAERHALLFSIVNARSSFCSSVIGPAAPVGRWVRSWWPWVCQSRQPYVARMPRQSLPTHTTAPGQRACALTVRGSPPGVALSSRNDLIA
jgi:hypothetical protein